MQQDFIIDSAAPPPPYRVQDDNDGIYLSDMDSNAWPSSYYGRSRRIDLAKFYHDILKASNNGDDQCNDSSSSSSDEEESRVTNQNNSICVTSTPNKQRVKKTVTFTDEPPTVHEYEPEFDNDTNTNKLSLFDDGWPGRTKIAMKSTGFIDFKSKIEAKLGAINDPSLISELDKSNENVDESSLLYNQEESPLYRGYYRNRKSPLVKKLNLRPIPNTDQVQPSLILDDTPSPSNSFTDSPLTPKDTQRISFIDTPSTSTTSTTSSLTPGGSKWLNRTLSRIRSTSRSSK